MSGLDGTISHGLTEPEQERLMRAVTWAFNKGREFRDNPTILDIFANINWRTAKYPQDTGQVCLNCYNALIKGENK